jgi:hypothetical protein
LRLQLIDSLAGRAQRGPATELKGKTHLSRSEHSSVARRASSRIPGRAPRGTGDFREADLRSS